MKNARNDYVISVAPDLSEDCEGCLFINAEADNGCLLTAIDSDFPDCEEDLSTNSSIPLNTNKYVLVHRLMEEPLAEDDVTKLVELAKEH